jgi:hypothetical protein
MLSLSIYVACGMVVVRLEMTFTSSHSVPWQLHGTYNHFHLALTQLHIQLTPLLCSSVIPSPHLLKHIKWDCAVQIISLYCALFYELSK